MSRRNQSDQIFYFGRTGFTAAGNQGAAPAIDPTLDEVVTAVLTANATVAAPAASTPGAVNIGSRFYLVVIQDATGTRTLAWNAAWRNAPAMTAGTANQRASFEFRWDGVSWQFVGGSTAFA